MNIGENLFSLIDFEALIQGVLLGIILIIRNNKYRPTALLGLFLIGYTGDLLDVILRDTYLIADYPEFIFLPFNFYFLAPPLLYLYAKRLMRDVDLKKHFWLLMPGLVEFLIFLFLFFLPVEKKVQLAMSDEVDKLIESYQFVSLVYGILFAFMTIRLIKEHQVKVLDYYSNTETKRLRWLKGVAMVIVVFYACWILFFFLEGTGLQETVRGILSIANVVFIFWVGFAGLLQTKMEPDFDKTEPAIADSLEEDEDLATEERNKQMFLHFRKRVEQEKLYKKADLTLPALAEIFEVSRWTLSRMINQYGGVNFSRFINEYRVKEAEKILCDENYNHLNMLGIAGEVGFSSKATFFAVFKQINGVSPGNFKKNCKNTG